MKFAVIERVGAWGMAGEMVDIVGGDHDGLTVDVDPGQRQVTLRSRRPAAGGLPLETRYERAWVHFPGNRHIAYYRPWNWTDEQAIKHLLEARRKKGSA